jgi:hypothetical protein
MSRTACSIVAELACPRIVSSSSATPKLLFASTWMSSQV